jgi:hypothetical protein
MSWAALGSEEPGMRKRSKYAKNLFYPFILSCIRPWSVLFVFHSILFRRPYNNDKIKGHDMTDKHVGCGMWDVDVDVDVDVDETLTTLLHPSLQTCKTWALRRQLVGTSPEMSVHQVQVCLSKLRKGKEPEPEPSHHHVNRL